MAQKTNPNRKPATQADVDKAYMRGKNDAVDLILAVSLLSLSDIFNPTAEQMKAYNDKFNTNVSCVMGGKLKYAEIAETLKQEYDLEVVFK